MNALRLYGPCCLALLIGCSGSAPPRYPVLGEVHANDVPLADALVVFHPQFATPPGQPKPLAITDAQGKFQLTTLQANDGAPPGDYCITVELQQERLSGEELTRDGPNLLPAKYARPETTPFRFTVTSGKNEAPPLIISK